MKDKPQLRTNFFNFTTERPVAILMVVIGVFVFGLISYQQLPLNLMPDMSYPSLTVRTEYLGTAPEEIETTISRPIEQALGVVDNLVSISSVSKAEQSDVILEFTWDTDMNKATADVREKLDQVFLPQEVRRPIILRYDPTLDPIIRIGLFGDAGLTYLRYLAEEEIKRALETVEGVAAVKVKGGLEEEIRVELNEQKMTLIGIDIQTIKARLAEENVNLAGGNLKEGETEYLVRTLNEFKTIDEIRNVVVGRWNGVDIKVRDIGKVYRTSKEREIITRIDGKESVEIEIYKEADANIVAVAKRVKNKLYGTPQQRAFVRNLEKRTQKEKKETARRVSPRERRREAMLKKSMTNFLTYGLPEGVHIETLSDQSIFIENSINEVKSTAIMGGILAIIVLFVFLRRLGPTVIIGLSIPISIVATFAPMKMFGVSLNIMSLGGLALGIGMLVDNSIVVLESITRCREEGDGLIRATLRGVSEVGGAVIASTLTTIAVFFPIVFVEGVAGQVFGDLALTVVFSLLASLAIALFLIPMLSSRTSEAFMKGVDSKSLPEKYVLRFDIQSEIDRFTKDKAPSVISKIVQLFRLLFKTTLSWLWKSAQIFLSFFFVLFKMLLLVVGVFIHPLMALVQVFYKELEYGKRIKAFAQKVNVQFVEELWPGFQEFKSVEAVYSRFAGLRDQMNGRSRIVNIFWFIVPLYEIKSVYFVFEFLIYALLEFSFRLFHAFAVFIGTFIMFVVLISRLLFAYPARWLVSLFDLGYNWVEKSYPKMLTKSLEKKYTVLGAVLIVFLVTLFGIGPRLGSELIPEVHQGEFYVNLTMPVGTPVERTDKRVLPIQQKITALPEVAKVASVCGTDKNATTDSEQGEHTAKLTVTLKPVSNVERMEERVIAKIRNILKEYSGLVANISRPALFSFKTPVEVHLKGYNLRELQRLSHELEDRMSEIDGLVDVKSNIQRGNPEVQIYYDRQLISRYGLNILNVASIVRNKVRGDVATEFKEQDRRIDILVRLRDQDKESIDALKRIIINPQAPIPIPLQSVAEIRVHEGPSEIRRVDQQRTAVITGNLLPGANLNEVNQAVFEEIQKLDLPDGFGYELAGQNKEMETSLNSLMMALALAIFLVYIVMASQFESLIHPFIIIFTIPLAMIGVIIFLYLLNIPLSIVVFLGMIMLAGIVVNNAIVLVDYINHLRRQGMEITEAIVQAGKVRLRPILMTTSTTVLGLLPMAIGLGDGAEIRTPMAITVIVGLLSSTILTLVVIPTIYYIVSQKNLPLEQTATAGGEDK
ncbi:MAG TPA: AcrB/AcrD/AcrF family protein [Caldithrix abyssi]|uniref:AcrB/AcrD/AcrF family protein n=1 Tax=Caldithrix abyssi TaxID=187145 RepID=A0A7V4TYU7_CALAY|nr:AcrB/AcrD/AcrF family protein [Caldithrix abyssi]